MNFMDFIEVSPDVIKPFRFFSLNHIITIIIVMSMVIVIPILLKRQGLSPYRRIYEKILFVMIIVFEVAYKLWNIFIMKTPIRENLSLQLCGVTIILCAIILVNRSEKLFEIVYFLGLGGAMQAILTPELGVFGFPHYKFIHNFISHGLIIGVVLYLAIVKDFRPKAGSIKRIFIISNGYMAFVGVINYLLGTNYLYIAHKPQGTSLLTFLGPWPWYLISLEAIAMILFILLYLPYYISDNHKKKDKNSEDLPQLENT